MENIQINGQKIWGPPKDWVGPPPPYGTEIFIKNIPNDVVEDELYDLYSSIGKIYEVRVPVHWTGVNKGYAFVRYTKISEADKAINKLNQWPIRPYRHIKVERSVDNTRLFLSSVPNDKTGEEIKSDLLTVVENVKNVYVYPALENPTTFRGYAFVEFVCHRDAAIAKRILTPDVLFNLFEKKCIAAWANPLPYLGKGTLKNINILFIRNISSNTKTNTIKIAVDSLIHPDNVYKVKRVNDFAFLTFKNHDIAERARNKIINNPYFLGTDAVLVEWAIPRELVNSTSTKGTNVKKQNEQPIVETRQDLLFNDIEDYKNNQPKFTTEKQINNCLNIENIPNMKIIKKRNPKLEPFSALNQTKTLLNKTDANAGFEFDTLCQNNVNKQGQYCTPALYQNYSTPEEFCYSTSENYYRNMHLSNWLQPLSLSEKTTFSASSPTLTSPSTSSSTNLSSKWDEGCSQYSFGSLNSVGHEARTIIADETEHCEKLQWY